MKRTFAQSLALLLLAGNAAFAVTPAPTPGAAPASNPPPAASAAPAPAAPPSPSVSTASYTILPAEKLLPDDTLVMLSIPDFNRARQIYSNSPQGRLWNDPAMKDFKDKFFSKLSGGYIDILEHDLGAHFADYTNLPQGQFTLAFIQNTWHGKDGEPAFLLLLDTKDKSSALKTDLDDLKKKWINSGKKLRIEKIRDVDFSVVNVSKADFIKASAPADSSSPDLPPPMPPDTNNMARHDIYIGQAGSVFIAADSAKVIEKVLAKMSGGSVNVLNDLAAFDADRAMFHDAPIYGWANTKSLVDIFSHSSETTDADAAANPFAFQTDKILAGLGLNALKSVAFSFRFSDEGSQVNVTFSVPEAARTGLVKLLAGQAQDCTPPAFVPADAVKFQRWRFDGPKTWPTIRKTVTDIVPAAGGFLDLTLSTVEEQAKEKDPSFDLNKNLFGNIGGDIVTYEKTPRPGSTDPNSGPSIFLLGSPNPDQFVDAMKHLLVLSPQGNGPTDREFLGHKIYSLQLPNPQQPGQPKAAPAPTRTLSYTTSGGYVAFSSDPAILEEYLRTADSQPKSLRDTPGLTDAKQKVAGSDASLFGFSNEAEAMRATFAAMRSNPDAPDNMVAFGIILPFLGYGDVKSKDWMDASLLPPFEKISKYFYFTVYGANTTPDGINVKIFAPTPPELRK